jgi:transposase
MSDHHRRMIRYSLEHLKFLEEQLQQMDRDIAEQIRAAGLEEQWRLLRTVPGLQDRSAANVLAETGADMQQFPTPFHRLGKLGIAIPGYVADSPEPKPKKTKTCKPKTQ